MLSSTKTNSLILLTLILLYSGCSQSNMPPQKGLYSMHAFTQIGGNGNERRPVRGAPIIIENLDSTILAQLTTDFNGNCSIRLDPAKYILKPLSVPGDTFYLPPQIKWFQIPNGGYNLDTEFYWSK